MSIQITLTNEEINELDKIGDEALDTLESMEPMSLELDICDVIGKVIPILKFVKRALRIIPGTGKIRRAVNKAIEILEELCPD